ncbi:MAG: hypothetical protein COA78_34410 [Blastopirellula sp.]|nr:MAG: hypothetical protein COA78_34410 [Blastopirellula sp.]
MEPKSSIGPTESDQEPPLGAWLRIYLHGILAFVVLYAVSYMVTMLVPIFDFTGSQLLAIMLSILAILLVPPLVGSLIIYGLLPLIGLKEGWRGVIGWDTRLFARVSAARQKSRIVIINWPSKEVRTLGILTSTFTADDSGEELAAVYVPTAPSTRYGYIRVVALDEVEITNMTLKEWQLFQLSFGSISPECGRADQDIN